MPECRICGEDFPNLNHCDECDEDVCINCWGISEEMCTACLDGEDPFVEDEEDEEDEEEEEEDSDSDDD